MKRFAIQVVLLVFFSLGVSVTHAKTYGAKLCKENGYTCYKVVKGDTWEKLFPEESERSVIKRINRKNVALRTGQTIAIPQSQSFDIMAHAPFPLQVDPFGEKVIVIDKAQLAFGAYNPNGTLANWGPISGGKSYCPDVGRGCSTPSGHFEIYTKRGAGCKSTKYPIGKGGAPMPYCMFFKGGYAMHGSPTVPGYHDSHGCVRMFTEDAKWINTEFANGESVRVIIK